MGTDGCWLPLWSRTHFKLLDKLSIKRRHLFGSCKIPISWKRPSTSWQKQKEPATEKYFENLSCLFLDKENWQAVSNKFHCLSLDVRSSAFDFVSPISLIKSFNSSWFGKWGSSFVSESDAVYSLSESFPNSSSKSKSSWDVLAGGLGIGNSLLWGLRR